VKTFVARRGSARIIYFWHRLDQNTARIGTNIVAQLYRPLLRLPGPYVPWGFTALVRPIENSYHRPWPETTDGQETRLISLHANHVNDSCLCSLIMSVVFLLTVFPHRTLFIRPYRSRTDVLYNRPSHAAALVVCLVYVTNTRSGIHVCSLITYINIKNYSLSKC